MSPDDERKLEELIGDKSDTIGLHLIEQNNEIGELNGADVQLVGLSTEADYLGEQLENNGVSVFYRNNLEIQDDVSCLVYDPIEQFMSGEYDEAQLFLEEARDADVEVYLVTALSFEEIHMMGLEEEIHFNHYNGNSGNMDWVIDGISQKYGGLTDEQILERIE